MSEQTYRGSCHCQAVAFEAPLDLDNAITCNCSRCERLGWTMSFAPREKLRFLKGEGTLREYLFNTGRIRHQFCPTCGIEPFCFAVGKDGVEMAAVSVNCLEGVDRQALSPKAVDGRSV